MKSFSSFKARASKGFGLLEVILVFAIVIGAAAVVFTVFQSAKPSADASNEASNLTTIATNLKSTYGINHNYPTSLGNPDAIKAKAIPSSMIAADGSTVSSQWGAVTVAGKGPTFTITYAGVPSDACAKFVSGVAGFFPDGIGTGTAGATNILANGVFATGQPIAACAGTSGASTVTVSFTGR